MNILYLEDDFINAEQSKNIINFYNNHLTKTFVYGSNINQLTYPLNILNQYKNEQVLNDSISKIIKIQLFAIHNTNGRTC